MAKRVRGFVKSQRAQIHVIITSPYFRCVQTAVEMCLELGASAVQMLLDHSLGELLCAPLLGLVGPSCRGRSRDFPEIIEYCNRLGVTCHGKAVGQAPEAACSENGAAQQMYAERVLMYLRRSRTAQHNLLFVTHADCVFAALEAMPSWSMLSCRSQVEYGSFFLARRTAAQPSPTEEAELSRIHARTADLGMAAWLVDDEASSPALKQASKGWHVVLVEGFVALPRRRLAGNGLPVGKVHSVRGSDGSVLDDSKEDTSEEDMPDPMVSELLAHSAHRCGQAVDGLWALRAALVDEDVESEEDQPLVPASKEVLLLARRYSALGLPATREAQLLAFPDDRQPISRSRPKSQEEYLLKDILADFPHWESDVIESRKGSGKWSADGLRSVASVSFSMKSVFKRMGTTLVGTGASTKKIAVRKGMSFLNAK